MLYEIIRARLKSFLQRFWDFFMSFTISAKNFEKMFLNMTTAKKMKWKDWKLGVLSDQIPTIRARRTFYTEPVAHFLSEYKSIAGTWKNYCYILKAHQDHFYCRKYTCMTCKNCRSFETDPSSGSVKCLQEKTAGTWTKGKFIRKKAVRKIRAGSDEDESFS